MKILIGIPLFRIAELAAHAIRAALDYQVDVLLIDNNADPDMKAVIDVFKEHPNISVIRNKENTFCNGAWNQILQFGIEHHYDLIGLSSSDVILPMGWAQALVYRAAKHKDEVYLPAIAPVLNIISNVDSVEYVTGSVAGACTFLPPDAAKSIYPIPESLKMWFGDEWIYTILKQLGWKITILNNIQATHEQSAVTLATPEAYIRIEADKVAWPTLADELIQRVGQGTRV